MRADRPAGAPPDLAPGLRGGSLQAGSIECRDQALLGLRDAIGAIDDD